MSALIATAILSGCADTPVPTGRTASSSSSYSIGGGIDPITEAGIDETTWQTQEDAQRMSDWVMQQQNQQIQDQANQMAAQAAMDASNAAAAAANQQPIITPPN